MKPTGPHQQNTPAPISSIARFTANGSVFALFPKLRDRGPVTATAANHRHVHFVHHSAKRLPCSIKSLNKTKAYTSVSERGQKDVTPYPHPSDRLRLFSYGRSVVGVTKSELIPSSQEGLSAAAQMPLPPFFINDNVCIRVDVVGALQSARRGTSSRSSAKC